MENLTTMMDYVAFALLIHAAKVRMAGMFVKLNPSSPSKESGTKPIYLSVRHIAAILPMQFGCRIESEGRTFDVSQSANEVLKMIDNGDDGSGYPIPK